MSDFEIEYKVEGLEKLIEKTQRDRLIGPPVREFFNRAIPSIKRKVKKGTPVDTGRLRSSITHFISVATVPLWGKVGTNVFYAPFVELGTKPHFPPPKALARWAHLHGFAKGGEYALARAIARRGTRAHEMFKGGFEDSKTNIEHFAQEACKKIEDIWSRK